MDYRFCKKFHHRPGRTINPIPWTGIGKHIQLVPLEINIDALEVLTRLKKDNIIDTNILVDYRYLLDQLRSATIAHIYRKGNEVADGLANTGCNMDSTDKSSIFGEPPEFVSTFSQRDQAGATRFRKATCTRQE